MKPGRLSVAEPEGPPAMQRKITRLALTGKCGCRRPRQSGGAGQVGRRRRLSLATEHRRGDAPQAVGALVEKAASADGQRITIKIHEYVLSAPCVPLSAPRDHFLRVEQHAGQLGPGDVLDRIEFGPRGEADDGQLLGFGGHRGKRLPLARQKRGQRGGLRGPGLAVEGEPAGQSDPGRVVVRLGGREKPGGEGPGGRITRIRYVLPRHKAANWVGRGRGRKSTRPGANGAAVFNRRQHLQRSGPQRRTTGLGNTSRDAAQSHCGFAQKECHVSLVPQP
jgi:hypothetical protein